MRLEVGDGSDAGGFVLDDASHHRHHGESPVCDFLNLQHLHLFRVLGHAHGVEKAFGVPNIRVRVAFVRAREGVLVHRTGVLHVLPPANFRPVHHKHLHDEQRVGGRHVPVPQRGFRPVGHGAFNERVLDELGGGHTGHAQHRPPRVLQLRLLVPLKRDFVLAQTQGVETVVAGHGAVKVLGGGRAGEEVGAGRGNRADAHGCARLGGHRAGANGAGSLGEPGGKLLRDDGGHLDLDWGV
mmetsp:Transcript_7050/g.26667  ORF Transcript_7050/g.26667 Transcript_7050/m.26667 type:complete len:240 (-) Transcript_7050:41-760(-)